MKTKKSREANKKLIVNFKNFWLISILMVFFLLPNTAYFSSISEQDIIDTTNEIRNNLGLNKLIPNTLLIAAARQKANDIFKYQSFQHNLNGEKFSSWVKKTNYEYYYVGENLAINFTTSEKVIDAWLDSETHRKNIVNENFKEIGVAVVDGEFQNKKTTVIVQIFGSPLSEIKNITPTSQLSTSSKPIILNNSNQSKNKSDNNLNFYLIITLLTSVFFIVILKTSLFLENLFHHKKIHNKIKARINL